MTDFNPIQIITNITTRIANANLLSNNAGTAGGANAAPNTGGAGQAQNFANNFQQPQGSGAQISFQAAPIVLSASSELKLTTIEIEQKADYVKDLLNLPREFTDLINEITSGANLSSAINQQMAEQLKQLLQNGKINLSMLSSLLCENSKEAMQKLMMTIANISKYGANDVSNLKELMNLFAANTALVQDTQALKNLLLLYLPWLPLSSRYQNELDFTIDIFDKIQGPDPNKDNPTESVTVLIETKNFSNITATLETNPLGQIDVNIQAVKEFPHKKAMELLKEHSAMNNVTANITTGENISSKNVSAGSGSVKITSQSSISPKLMLMTQSLIKIIINIDYEETIIKNKDEGNINGAEEK